MTAPTSPATPTTPASPAAPAGPAPTGRRRRAAARSRAATQAVAAVAALLMSAVACTASNHMGSESRADPGAARSTTAQLPPGMRAVTGAPNAPAARQARQSTADQQSQADQQNPAAASRPAARPAIPLSGFATATGCAPPAPTAGQQLRQTACTTTTGARYSVAAFASDTDQRQWLQATLGGGSFLVGDRWAVGADGVTLQSLQRVLGGTVADG
jgi:hypothetical protein